MQQKATVISVDDKKRTATVRIVRNTACDTCHANCSGSCHTMVENPPIEVEIKNNIGAVRGDHVNIETASGKILLLSTVLYLVPLLLCAMVYFILCRFTSIPVLAGICAATFAIAFVGMVLLCNRMTKKYIHYEMIPENEMDAV